MDFWPNFYDFLIDSYWFLCWFLVISVDFDSYLDSRGRSYQNKRLKVEVHVRMVPLHWNSHFLETVLLPLGQKPQKHQKRRHFKIASLLGLENLILNKGASHHYKRFAEGLVHWNSLVSKYFCLVDIVKRILKMHVYWPFFVLVQFWHFCGFDGDKDCPTSIYYCMYKLRTVGITW